MKILITETEDFDTRFLQDLAEHNSIKSYVEDLVNNKTRFVPLDLDIKFGDRLYRLLRGGEKDINADKTLEKINMLKESIAKIPNDRMFIRTALYEKELFIDLDGDEFRR